MTLFSFVFQFVISLCVNEFVRLIDHFDENIFSVYYSIWSSARPTTRNFLLEVFNYGLYLIIAKVLYTLSLRSLFESRPFHSRQRNLAIPKAHMHLKRFKWKMNEHLQIILYSIDYRIIDSIEFSLTDWLLTSMNNTKFMNWISSHWNR